MFLISHRSLTGTVATDIFLLKNSVATTHSLSLVPSLSCSMYSRLNLLDILLRKLAIYPKRSIEVSLPHFNPHASRRAFNDF